MSKEVEESDADEKLCHLATNNSNSVLTAYRTVDLILNPIP